MCGVCVCVCVCERERERVRVVVVEVYICRSIVVVVHVYCMYVWIFAVAGILTATTSNVPSETGCSFVQRLTLSGTTSTGIGTRCMRGNM